MIVMNTPDNITELKANEVFVFGSNLAGNHAGGAARQAAEQFDAEDGVGEGLTGQCYAFPTMDKQLKRLTARQVGKARTRFYKVVDSHPGLTFLLTKVGCGIAGFDETKIRKIFVNAPKNVIKPKGW